MAIGYNKESHEVRVSIPSGDPRFSMFACAMRVSDIVLPSGDVPNVFYSAPQYANIARVTLSVDVGSLGADPVSFSVELVCNTVNSPTNKAYYNRFDYVVT